MTDNTDPVELDIQLLDENKPTILFCRHDGENHPQPVHVRLSLRTGVLTADYDPRIGGGVGTFDEKHDVVRTFPLSTAFVAADVNGLLRDAEPLARRILAGAGLKEDDNRTLHGFLVDDDADAAEEELLDMCAQFEGKAVAEVTAKTWWNEDDPATSADPNDDPVLTADTTDAKLKELAAAAEWQARDHDAQYYTVLTGAYEFLARRREELREQLRDELAEIGRQTGRRDNLIIQQRGWNTPADSLRAIAHRANLTHGRIDQICKAAAEHQMHTTTPGAECAPNCPHYQPQDGLSGHEREIANEYGYADRHQRLEAALKRAENVG